MKKSTLFLFVLFLMMSSSTFGQHVIYKPVVPKRFKVGDMYYASNYNGLKDLMSDLSVDQPELHEVLLPQFKVIESKRKKANISWISGCVVGGTLFIAGIHSNKNLEFGEHHNSSLMFAGVGVMITGTILSRLFIPKSNDYYRFINIHNKNSIKDKMEWKIGLNVSPEQYAGIKLAMQF